jgi:hypothetical protein
LTSLVTILKHSLIIGSVLEHNELNRETLRSIWKKCYPECPFCQKPIETTSSHGSSEE